MRGSTTAIASGGGRLYITMDRYNADWPMVKRGWDTHVKGIGRPFSSATEAIETLRRETPGIIDQDLSEFVIVRDGKPVGPIVDGDSVILFNFRGDRAIEISRAFDDPELDTFERGPIPNVNFAGIMQYDADLQIPKTYLVSPPSIDNVMGEYLAKSGVRELAVSETQKFGHVTYFFNGNRSGKFDDALEEYVEITSDLLPFEQRPWMKAGEITDVILDSIRGHKHDFIRANYPNGDMVGHTGNNLAVEIAVETVDLCVGRLIKAIEKAKGILIVTADHGNADEMFELDKNDQPKLDGRWASEKQDQSYAQPGSLLHLRSGRDGKFEVVRRSATGHQQLGRHGNQLSRLPAAGRLRSVDCRSGVGCDRRSVCPKRTTRGWMRCESHRTAHASQGGVGHEMYHGNDMGELKRSKNSSKSKQS